ncbi:MAG: SNF2-related protein [Minicystis sp.]
MSARDVQWLQSFLDLGARGAADGVPPAEVARQEATVLRALDMLDDRPGVVLADEVGMGKTFEAIGVIAACLHGKPEARVVILTPGPDLTTKWMKELSRFEEGRKKLYDFQGRYKSVSSLAELVTKLRTTSIVVAPVNIFSGKRGAGVQAHLITLYGKWKGLHPQKLAAIFRRFREGQLEAVPEVRSLEFLDIASFHEIEPHLEHAFCGKDGDEMSLDVLYRELGADVFANDDAIRRALDLARYRLVGALLPPLDLLVLDEAHKLKNADTVRARGVTFTFDRRFHKALFLTATPFQLDVSELRQVFSVFALATTAPANLIEQVDGLFAAIERYKEAYRAFEAVWFRVDPDVSERFAAAFSQDPSLSLPIDDPSVRDVAAKVSALLTLKRDSIEPAFRAWMIRSLREDKRKYRNHEKRPQVPEGGASLPFLVYERFLAELFRQGKRTHKASVEINMVSSYGAAREGALLADASDERFDGDLAEYRDVLRDVVGELRGDGTAHPKMQFVLRDTLDAAERGEKTLVFCARIATLTDLARDIDAEWEGRLLGQWREVYPGAAATDIFDSEDEGRRERGRHSKLQRRFHAARDALYLALRERYAQSILLLQGWPMERLPEIVKDANRRLQGVRTRGSAADKLDYRIAKRCLEQAAAALWQAEEPGAAADYEEPLRQLLHPRFIELGLDLEDDDLEGFEHGGETPRWTITEEVGKLVLSPVQGVWSRLAGQLEALDFPMRVRLIEKLSRYLTYKQVTFLPDLLRAAKSEGIDVEEIESRALLAFMDRFWMSDAGRRWVQRLNAFLKYFGDRDGKEQSEILEGPISTGEFVRHTEKAGESRERLRIAFNTPLYPMVLIANEVMQEGLDLHRSCRRIVHHDLAWNPAQLEQRVGRIDRLGSRTLQLRAKEPTAVMDVVYPLIHRTIDERLYRTVKMREKWLEFLLGAAPTYEEYSLENETPPPLPDGLAEELRVNLRP